MCFFFPWGFSLCHTTHATTMTAPRPRTRPTATATANNTTHTQHRQHSVKVEKPQVTVVSYGLCGLTVVCCGLIVFFFVVGLWFDRVSKNHCHLLFCQGHWLLEGSQATTKTTHHTQKPQATSHTPHATRHTSHQPPATSHTQHTKTTHHKPSRRQSGRVDVCSSARLTSGNTD